MPPQKEHDAISLDHNHDGIDRRGFLKCMAWAGTGALCVLEGGVLKSYGLDDPAHVAKAAKGETLTAPAVDSINTFAAPRTVVPKPIAASLQNGKLTLTLEPKSVTVVSLEQ